MKRYGELYSDINNLVSILSSPHIQRAIAEYYASYNNEAVPQLVKTYMDKLQEHLDNAKP